MGRDSGWSRRPKRGGPRPIPGVRRGGPACPGPSGRCPDFARPSCGGRTRRRPASGRGDQLVAQPRLLQQPPGGSGEGLRVVHRHGQARLLVLTDPGHAAVGDRRVDHRAAAGHRLDLHNAESLAAGVRREPEGLGRQVVGNDIQVVRQVAGEDDAVAHPQPTGRALSGSRSGPPPMRISVLGTRRRARRATGKPL